MNMKSAFIISGVSRSDYFLISAIGKIPNNWILASCGWN